jgi:TonB family protein
MVPLPARRADDPEPLQPDTPSDSLSQPQIEELRSRLEAHGIQSSELVLDLVLHDLADEARQAVGATGAAVALERDGELVCRAAAGSTAPDLGVRIHTESGLSGICVKQGRTQICSDTEADDRVDAEACRQLGVRSMVVIPLFAAERVIGVFEVFSARPNAYAAEDVKKLESLAATAAQTVQGTRQKAALPADTKSSVIAEIGPEPPAALSVDSIMEKVSPMDPAVRVLRWLVIGLAIPLLILIGFDWGWHRVRSPIHPAVVPPVEQAAEAEPAAEARQSTSSVSTTTAADATKAVAAKPKIPADIAGRGGLVIYQNGKVIYREFPSAAGSQTGSKQGPTASKNEAAPDKTSAVPMQSSAPEDTSAASLPPGVTGGRLLRSVRPQYPAEAILDKREGAVVLHGIVGQDGVIRELKLVSGDPILSQAALEAVQQWTYEPYRRDGKPVDMPLDISIEFKLPK